MIFIAVCEDELECGVQIKRLTEHVLEEQGIQCEVSYFLSGDELLHSEKEFDLILMDVEMNEGHSGMETAQILRDRGVPSMLIFITAHEGYMQQSFDVEAFHYIVKPVEEGRFQQILLKAAAKQKPEEENYLLISVEHEKIKLRCSDIAYVEVMGRVCRFHMKETVYTAYERLGSVEQRLDLKVWVRVHKSFLVNLGCIKSFNKNEIILSNGESIPVSKRRYGEFRTAFLAFLERKGGVL